MNRFALIIYTLTMIFAIALFATAESQWILFAAFLLFVSQGLLIVKMFMDWEGK